MKKTLENWYHSEKIYRDLRGENNFDDYVKSCSLDDLIYLYVDRRPKDHVFTLALSLESEDNAIEEYVAENKRAHFYYIKVCFFMR